MDRYSTWAGAPARGRRVPPRVSPRRRGRGSEPRVVSWDGARRWWLVALGALATAAILPRIAGAQGLRSSVATISLTVTAPPRAANAVLSLGPSVADVVVTLPSVSPDAATVEVRLDEAPTSKALLYVRGSDGALAPVGRSWISVPLAAAATFRAIAPGGAPLGAASWRAVFRYTPRDPSARVVEARTSIEVPAPR